MKFKIICLASFYSAAAWNKKTIAWIQRCHLFTSLRLPDETVRSITRQYWRKDSGLMWFWKSLYCTRPPRTSKPLAVCWRDPTIQTWASAQLGLYTVCTHMNAEIYDTPPSWRIAPYTGWNGVTSVCPQKTNKKKAKLYRLNRKYELTQFWSAVVSTFHGLWLFSYLGIFLYSLDIIYVIPYSTIL